MPLLEELQVLFDSRPTKHSNDDGFVDRLSSLLEIQLIVHDDLNKFLDETVGQVVWNSPEESIVSDFEHQMKTESLFRLIFAFEQFFKDVKNAAWLLLSC